MMNSLKAINLGNKDQAFFFMKSTLFPRISSSLNAAYYLSPFIYCAFVSNTFMLPSRQVSMPR